ncbi:MAG: DUF5979 domain-containing protein, partial [Propionibacteriaceae bacterium]|nr:DUF5979 domain-containing protein [Propionibacteriaceae bacterium]
MSLIGALCFGSAWLGFEAAHAAPNPAIVVTPTKPLAKGKIGSLEPGQQIYVNDGAVLDLRWDATTADPKPGDSFSVQIPAAFKIRENRTIPMLDQKKAERGSCVLAQTQVTCTFNDSIVGKDELRGTLTMELIAAAAAAEDDLVFDLNGVATKIATDNKGGVKGRKATPLPLDQWAKTITPLSENTKQLNWQVKFMGATVSKTPDEPVEWSFTDKIGPGQELVGLMQLYRVNRTGDDGLPVSARKQLDTSAPGATDGYEVTFTQDSPTGLTVTLKGQFEARTQYELIYSTRPTTADGKVKKGFLYENEAFLGERRAYGARDYSETSAATIELKDGFGSFAVLKRIAGEAAAELGADQRFTAKVGWVLPNGKTPADYPQWEAPAANPASFEFTAGVPTGFDYSFPVGTVVTLQEDLGAMNPATPGISWEPAVFAKEGGVQIKADGSAEFTVANKTTTPVKVTNTGLFQRGTFSVRKTASGAPAADGREFSFRYECDDATSGEIKATAGGEAVTAPTTHRLGVSCTVSEVRPADLDGYSMELPEPQTVTVAEGNPVALTFHNAYAAKTGKFSIVKTVEGGPFTKDTFTFNYTCDNENGSLQVPGDGTIVESKEFPVGTQCQIEEDTASAQRTGFGLTGTLTQSSVRISDGAVVALAAKNVYTRETGTFSVRKQVTGDNREVFSKDKYSIKYTCDNGDAATLEVVGDGTPAAGPTLPTGTRCVVTEQEEGKARPGYTVVTTIENGAFVTVKDQSQEAVVTNHYRLKSGAFTVSKSVDGDAAALAPKSFVVDYSCVNEAGVESARGELTIKPGEQAGVPMVPAGKCTVKEREANVANAKWSSALAVDGVPVEGKEATFDVTDGSSIAVSLSNTYMLHRGGFSIAKTVTGADRDQHAARTFMFHYSCATSEGTSEGEVKGTVSVPGNGSAVEAGKNLPVGSTCQVSERSDSAQVAGYVVQVADPQTVTIQADTVTKLDFVNAYTYQLGTFKITKVVSGTSAEDKSFAFSYTCDDRSSGQVTVKGDGTATQAESQIRVGASCTVREVLSSAQISGFTLTAPADQVVKIGAKPETLVFVNAYTAVP